MIRFTYNNTAVAKANQSMMAEYENVIVSLQWGSGEIPPVDVATV